MGGRGGSSGITSGGPSGRGGSLNSLLQQLGSNQSQTARPGCIRAIIQTTTTRH